MWRLGVSRRQIVLRCSTFLLLVAIIARPGVVSGAQATPTAATPTLDLAAMMLLPADWKAAGLNFVGINTEFGTGWIDAGRIASVSVAGSHAGQPQLGQLLMKVQQLDGARAYQSSLKQMLAAGSTDVNQSILTQVAQFADERNADQMLTLITTTTDTKDVKPETNAPQIGDRSVVLRDSTDVGGDTVPRLYLAFRVKQVVAVVEVLGTVGAPDPQLDPGVTLAQRLASQVSTVLSTPGAPLSGLALNLGGIDYSPSLDGYVRLDHVTIPYAGQTPDDPNMTSRNQLYGDSDAVYGLNESLPMTSDSPAATTYSLRIMRFADAGTASTWIKKAPQAAIDSTKSSASAAGATFQSQAVNAGQRIGDASAVYSYTEQSGTTTWHGYQAYFQVGEYGAQLVFEAGYQVEADLVETLAAAQATCLKQGACPTPVTLPEKLAGTICPISVAGGGGVGTVQGTVAMPGADPARSGVFPGPAPTDQPPMAWRIDGNSLDQAAPMIADGVAYFPMASSMTLPSPPYNANVDEVVAVDAATGARKWCAIGVGAPHSALAIAGDLVIVPQSNEVVALDAATGAKRWHFDTAGDESHVAVAGDTLYVGSLDGGLVALNAKSGKALWRFQAPDEKGQPATIYTPAVADGMVYVPTEYHMYAIDAGSGTQRWQYASSDSLGTFSLSPAAGDGVVVIGVGLDLLALDAKSGAVRWQITPKGAVGGAPTIANGVVYASTGLQNDEVTGDASLDAFSTKDGSTLWTIPLKETGFAQAQPAYVDGVVFFTSGVRGANEITSTITAVAAKTGKTLWTVSLDGPPSSPIVVGGMVYAGTGYPGLGNGPTDKSGGIYAFGGSGSRQGTPVAHQPRSDQAVQP
ncbi:MAG TPA: PQQ-binding-like beta-propeller repeat protein [Thermomicrobiales bacterium]|nr:PQQ-binding-like beta-propeller repeat protein [Thermomicrobiales bacterium]